MENVDHDCKCCLFGIEYFNKKMIIIALHFIIIRRWFHQTRLIFPVWFVIITIMQRTIRFNRSIQNHSEVWNGSRINTVQVSAIQYKACVEIHQREVNHLDCTYISETHIYTNFRHWILLIYYTALQIQISVLFLNFLYRRFWYILGIIIESWKWTIIVDNIFVCINFREDILLLMNS